MQEGRNNAGNPQPQANCPIGKVHGRVRDVDPFAYMPMVVSLGPYHAGHDDLQHKEREKPLCMQDICTLSIKNMAVLDFLQEVIFPLREQALMYYLHGINDLRRGRNDVDDDIKLNFRFNLMLLHDAAFLLVAMNALPRRNPNQVGDDEQRRTSSHGLWTDVAIVHDLLLFENQVPLVVVDKLYQIATDRTDFSQIVENFVWKTLLKHPNSPIPDQKVRTTAHHLLHQCHMLLRPTGYEVVVEIGGASSAADENAGVKRRRWHRAMQYHVAGVGLTSKGNIDGGVMHHRLLDVEYSGGALEIPVLHVDDNTCSMLRNLIAMEQASTGVGHYVTAYCVFFSRLMCTAEDVTLLTKKGIVVHQLANDETVAAEFANLCKNVVFNEDGRCNYLREACAAADERYQSRVRNWMTWLKHKHFRNPWLAIGAVAAVVVTICTVVQAVFAVFPRN
uniref:Uncharacterized protein n=1 Tax=Oryza barthii TaxID=65489 RepID=A0A0D3H4X6_9ORYZ